MARKPLLTLTLLALPLAPIRAQDWSSAELRDAIDGFLEDSLQLQLPVIGQLLRHEEEAYAAVAAWIHGDHRDYLLRVERLLDSLSDDRWSVREDAERTLVETGAMARSLLEKRANDTTRPLEEQIRCKRILDRLTAIGTDKEEREVRLLRGLVNTALYMDSKPLMLRALHSALRHTDPIVVEGSLRAIGALGGEGDTNIVAQMLEAGQFRSVAMAALPRIEGEGAIQLCRELIAKNELSTAETMTLIRGLRDRQDARGLLESLKAHEDPLVAKAAALELPPAEGDPRMVQLTLADRTILSKPFLGFVGDSIEVENPAPGLGRAEIPFSQCDILDFDSEAAPTAANANRAFLSQGSLVTGIVTGLDPLTVTMQTPVFGEIQLPRAKIQGLALDPDLDRLVGASTKHDRVRLKDDSFLEGFVRSIEDGQLVVQDLEGDESSTPLDQIAGILLQRPIQPEQDSNIYYRVDLSGGDRLLAYLSGVSDSHMVLAVPSLGSAVVPVADVTHVELGVGGGALWGFTLIADYSDNRLVEVDDQGREVFEVAEVFGAWDVECLDSGNLLITEFSVSRVQEVTRDGDVIWVFEDLKNPYDADRLPNGNTLIADTFGGRVIEVDSNGSTVWAYEKEIRPFDTDRLVNGNTLIADVLKDRVIEVDPNGEIVWSAENLPNIHDADRLPNGNTLITLRTVNTVVEIDRNGKVVFEIANLNSPSDADRLPNGHTLVAENGMVREFDRRGNVIWTKEMTWAVEVNRY